MAAAGAADTFGTARVLAGAAFDRPVTPSTLASTAAGIETGPSLARSAYSPALTLALGR